MIKMLLTSKTKKSFKESGFTLTEILIASAITAGVGLYVAKLVSDQASAQNHITTMAEITRFVSVLESHLKDPEKCTKILSGMSGVSTLGKSNKLDNPLLEYQNGPTKLTILREGEFDYFNIPDNGVSFRESLFPNTSNQNLLGKNIQLRDLTIFFEPNKKLSLSSNRGAIERRIPIILQLTPDEKVDKCGPVISEADETTEEDICNLMPTDLFKYESGECKVVEKKCPDGEVMKSIKVGENKFEFSCDKIPAKDLFDINQTQDCRQQDPLKFKFISSDGQKIKIICL
jgi:prepilin-type N-terminal cleavage/methylation domain-containing protein